MPDIAMCSAALCPDSNRCHRHEDSGTVPSHPWQSYWPSLGEQKLGAEDCEMFWPKERPDMGAADAFMEIFGFTRADNEED